MQNELRYGAERLEYTQALRRAGFHDGFVALSEDLFHVLDAHGRWKIALVELKNVGNCVEVVTLALEIHNEVFKRLDVGIHPLFLRVGDEDDAINTFQDELARGVVKDLPGDRVQVKACLESSNRAEFERKKVEEECSICLSRKGNQFSLGAHIALVVDVLEVRRLPAKAGAVIDDLAVDFA